jgi:hypothetical protein
LLEARYIEACRQINIYGEIGFMKVDGIVIQSSRRRQRSITAFVTMTDLYVELYIVP